ncbi:hypothetical protein D3C75_1026360 [compost metagenome]
MSFLIEAIVLSTNKDQDSWKFKLSVIENPETIELQVTENSEGDFEELLQTRLKPFLEQGVTVLSEETYNRFLDEQMAKYLGLF